MCYLVYSEENAVKTLIKTEGARSKSQIMDQLGIKISDLLASSTTKDHAAELQQPFRTYEMKMEDNKSLCLFSKLV